MLGCKHTPQGVASNDDSLSPSHTELYMMNSKPHDAFRYSDVESVTGLDTAPRRRSSASRVVASFSRAWMSGSMLALCTGLMTSVGLRVGAVPMSGALASTAPLWSRNFRYGYREREVEV